MLSVIPEDFATYMGLDLSTRDYDRVQMLLDLAEAECLSVVDPLPDTAARVILSASARAFSNPTGVTSELVGPYQASRPWAGVYLTKSERASLRRAAGSGGAFSVDPTPADAGPNKSWIQVPYDGIYVRGDFDWDGPTS